MTTANSPMTTRAIAARLAELCRKGDFETAQKELFAKDAVSIEPYATDDFEKETKGLDEILAKGEKFQSMVEAMHGGVDISDPVFAENSFALSMTMDITMKQKGRMKMSELCVYEVKDGKIVSEQFFM
jgi:limonene-1,2-epoxide hydrolase